MQHLYARRAGIIVALILSGSALGMARVLVG